MTESIASSGCFIVGEHRVDLGDNTISNATSSIHIEPKAMQVLYVLACHAGETVSRDQLMQQVWGGRVVVEDALTRAISKLRQAFSDGNSKQLIQTVPKKGYRLKATVLWDQVSVSLENSETDLESKQNQAEDSTVSQNSKAYSVYKIAGVVLVIVTIVALFYVSNEPENPSEKNVSSHHSIALLPLKNLTGEAQAGYLAEGIPEEISSILSRYNQLNVKSRYATYAYAKQGLPLKEIAQMLSVQYVVEGSVRSSEEQYRIVVRLIEAESEKVVWSSVFEDSSSQLYKVQSDVANGILHYVLPDFEGAKDVKSAPENVHVVAYQHYLTGLYWLMHGKTSEWFYLAEAAFLNAIEQDELFAAAWGRLAYVYARSDYHDVHMATPQALYKALQAIERAIELDPDEINAYLAKAILNTKNAAYEQAEDALKKALSMHENHPTALYLFSELELARNNFKQARMYAELALHVDPLSPWINVNLAIVQYWQGDFDAALKALDTAISVDREYTWAYVWQAKVFQVQGKLHAAIESMETCLKLDPGSTINSAWLGMLYIEAGEKDKADEWFAHTASLYGDSDDARFWQSYSRFLEEPSNNEIVHSLMQRLTLLDTPIFSLLPMFSQFATSAKQKDVVAKALIQALQIKENDMPWVNIHSYHSAKTLSSLSSSLIPQNFRASLQSQLLQFEAKLPVELLKINNGMDLDQEF